MIQEEKLKNIIATNITKFRKINSYTQAEFAEKLNYSDKAISKWERGESTPDIYTLSMIAETLGVTVNDLLNENLTPKVINNKKNKHPFVTILSYGLVWFIATFIFSIMKMFATTSFPLWKIFIITIPVSFIVLLVFCCLWYTNLSKALATSGLVWSLALTLHLTIPSQFSPHIIYIAAIPLEVLIIIWFIMRHLKKKKANLK